MRSLLPGKIYFLTLLFFSSVQMDPGKNNTLSLEQWQRVKGVNQSVPCENSTMASFTIPGAGSPKIPQHSVNQTPADVVVMESASLTMKCLLQINNSFWYTSWYKNGINDSLKNTSRMLIITSKSEKFSHLILKKTEIADSGIYTCILYDHKGNPFPSNGTRLFVKGITDLMVNQTPEHINQTEGTNVTIECRFRTVSDYSSIDVRWYRNQEKLNSTGDSLRIVLALERGFTSLTLTKAAVSDSGDYRCEVESKSRNLTGSGKASRVAVTTDLAAQDQDTELNGPSGTNPEHNKPTGTNPATIGAAAGAGVVILLLLVAGVIMWKCRSRRILDSRSEPETSPAKETGVHPLAHRASEVMYADLHFHKREVKPDAEVIYAEVRVPRKQQAC